jgi:hypothetical protein
LQVFPYALGKTVTVAVAESKLFSYVTAQKSPSLSGKRCSP